MLPGTVCIIRGCYRTDIHAHLIEKENADMDRDPNLRYANEGKLNDPINPHLRMEELPSIPLEHWTVNHPQHYGGDTTYETIKVIEAWHLDFCLGNVVKYISRAGKKQHTEELEDLEKAKWYLERRIQQLKKVP